jgi:hypothetical protein
MKRKASCKAWCFFIWRVFIYSNYN